LGIPRIALVIYEGAEELDCIGPYEVLHCARKVAPGVELHLETVALGGVPTEGDRPRVRLSNGLEVVADASYAGLAGFDVVILPGGPGGDRVERNEAFLSDLRSFASKGLLCSVCTGSMILAEAGVLEGRAATSHGRVLDELARYCRAESARVVEDGEIITARGVSASIDLGLAVVRRLWGDAVAEKIAKGIEYDSPYLRGDRLVRDAGGEGGRR